MTLRAASRGARRVMVVLGTRPEAIKLIPVIRALSESALYEPFVVATGQHREMLDQVLDLFSITPSIDLEIMMAAQTLTEVTLRALAGLSPVVEAEHPDAVLVQGDTTTTMVAALAAFYQHVPVLHLEAGLRTADVTAPFPEEANRRLTTRLASLHLAPTEVALGNLLREGVDRHQVIVTGNTVIDALLWAIEQRTPYDDRMLETLDNDRRRVVLVTCHRRESWGEELRSVGKALGDIARSEPDVVIVLPIHRNPVVRRDILPNIGELPNLWVREPLPYGEFARLMTRADIILTDSGGLQEEGPSLGKPVLVMRKTTERPEGVTAGAVRLVGTDRTAIVEEVRGLLHDQRRYDAMAVTRHLYGDGRAAERSVDAITYLLDGGPRPEDFTGAAPSPNRSGEPGTR